MEAMTLLLMKAHEGDEEAREILIRENLGLVYASLTRFNNLYVEREDLFQIGTIGLMKAVDRFDESFQVKFSTYAVPLIIGEIRRYLRDDGPLKISRTIKENGYRIRKWMNEYEAKTGKEADVERICQGLNLTGEEVVMALEAEHAPKSLYESVEGNDGKEMLLMEKIYKEGEEEKLLNHMLIEDALSELSGEERKIIYLRYFENKTQNEVAKIIGASQVKVSRMEKKILFQMKKRIVYE